MFVRQTESLWLLLFSLIVGSALGCFYDLLRLAVLSVFPERSGSDNSKPRLTGNEKEATRALYGIDVRIRGVDVLNFFFDLVFFTVSAFAVIILVFHLNYGRVRVFSLVSTLTGYIVYRKTVGKLVMTLLKRLLTFIKKVIIAFVKVTLFPILKIIIRLARPIIASIEKKRSRKRAVKILKLMEEKEITRRNKRIKNNERDKRSAHYGKGKRAVSESKRHTAKGHRGMHKKSVRGGA